MPRRLYQTEDCPRCVEVRTALDRLGLEYQAVQVPPGDRGEVRRLSGQEDLPLLVDGETVVAGSTAIFRHLVAAGNGAELLPDDARDRALAWILEAYAHGVLGPLVRQVVESGVAWPPAAAGGAPGPEDRAGEGDGPGPEGAAAALTRELRSVEALLTGRDYLLGDSPTLADLALHAFVSRLGGGDLPPLPGGMTRLRSWYARLRS